MEAGNREPPARGIVWAGRSHPGSWLCSVPEVRLGYASRGEGLTDPLILPNSASPRKPRFSPCPPSPPPRQNGKEVELFNLVSQRGVPPLLSCMAPAGPNPRRPGPQFCLQEMDCFGIWG